MIARGSFSTRHLPVLVLGAILLFTTAVYLPSLTDWFSRHDFIHLRGAAQTPALDYVRTIFTPGDGGNSIFATGDLYRPIYYLSFLATYPLFGLDPLGYRLVNLALHLANIVLVFLLARRLTGSPWAGLLAAAFFGVHPTLDDSVAWISSITDLLMGFFYLSFLLLFIQALDTPGLQGLGLYLLSLLAGTAIGGISALGGGWWDAVLMRGVDVLMSIPRIVIFLVCAAVLPPSDLMLILTLAATTWTGHGASPSRPSACRTSSPARRPAWRCSASDMTISS